MFLPPPWRQFLTVTAATSLIVWPGYPCWGKARISLNEVTFATSPYWYVLEKLMFQGDSTDKSLVFRQYAIAMRKGTSLDHLVKNIHLFVCQNNHLNYVSISLPEDMKTQGFSKQLWDPASKAHVQVEGGTFAHAAEVKAFEVFIDLDEVATRDFTAAFDKERLTWAVGPEKEKIAIKFEKPVSRTVKKIETELQKRSPLMRFSFEEAISECEKYKLTKQFVFAQRKQAEHKYWIVSATTSCTDAACQGGGINTFDLTFGNTEPYMTSKKECELLLSKTVSVFEGQGLEIKARCVNVANPGEQLQKGSTPSEAPQF